MAADLKVEQSEGDVLDQLLRHVLRIELGAELELQRRLLLDVLAEHLLVELEPGLVTLAVSVLQSEEPNLPQPDSFHHLEKKNIKFWLFSNWD